MSKANFLNNKSSVELLQECLYRLMESQKYKKVIAQAKEEIREAVEFSAKSIASSDDLSKAQKWDKAIALLKSSLKDLCDCQLKIAEINCRKSEGYLNLAIYTEALSGSKTVLNCGKEIAVKYAPIAFAVFTAYIEIQEMSKKIDRELSLDVDSRLSNAINGCVYFLLGAKSKRLKIGHSFQVSSRVKTLQASSPEELALLKTIPGSKQLEAKLHEKFAHLRLHGEWFKADTEIMKYIQSL